MTTRLVSADDHVQLGHDQVKANLATKFHADYDRAVASFQASMAKTITNEANERWRKQRDLEPSSGGGMGTGRAHPSFGRPGHTDPHERLQDMDTDGVDISSTYCEVSAFRYLYLLQQGSQEATRAFNTTLQEFASVDPRRLMVSYQIPIHDIRASVEEVKWAASQGCKSLQLPVFPAELGLPDYWESVYDRLWAAIQEAGLPICCHIGLNTQLESLARRDPTPQKGIFVPLVPLSSAEAFGMWIMGGVFERFPELRVVFVEPGLGWVAWWLYIVDDFVMRQGYEFPAITELPSHYFHQNVFLTFIDEPDVIDLARRHLGIENVMWSSDYPHPVSSWPKSPSIVADMFEGEPEADVDLVVRGNATRVWKL
jgi:predicted TIM-barrel fold metal-dependent hydrolase